ncbi:DUF445 domain-containing protein [Edaphovirga cremea]|uniref:DUF445 domain-containing protein n=1 Tax=Edaphovirga cremea TaxID=2267246 RepID=UPI003988AF22
MSKESELKKVKRTALLLLCGAAATFVFTLFFPGNFWLSGLKAIAEAAMVGALADWFAVVALFRRIPIPFISAHTEIIPKNKSKIADNLAIFVQDKFLDPDSIVGLIKKHDPAQIIAHWLYVPANTELLGGYLTKIVRAFLGITDDQRIQAFIKKAIHAFIDKADISQSVATLLDSMTRDGRHQELLDVSVKQVLKLLHQPSTRLYISGQIVSWVKREHPLKAKMLPTEWLGENGAEAISEAVGTLLDDVAADRGHALRQNFDRAVERLIEKLKNDPATARKAEEIKSYLKNDDALNTYVKQLWHDLREWLRQDLESKESVLHSKMAAAGRWLGDTLLQDVHLRESVNRHMEEAARKMAPDFAEYLTRHISDTVKSWDARDMSRQIELNIGKDLQFIRINGTLVGGFIGLALYLLSQLPHWIEPLFL